MLFVPCAYRLGLDPDEAARRMMSGEQCDDPSARTTPDFLRYRQQVELSMQRLRPGLGDMVASLLDSLGITKERVEYMAGSPCRCKERQAALNRAGEKLLGMSRGSASQKNLDD